MFLIPLAQAVTVDLYIFQAYRLLLGFNQGAKMRSKDNEVPKEQAHSDDSSASLSEENFSNSNDVELGELASYLLEALGKGAVTIKDVKSALVIYYDKNAPTHTEFFWDMPIPPKFQIACELLHLSILKIAVLSIRWQLGSQAVRSMYSTFPSVEKGHLVMNLPLIAFRLESVHF